LVVPVVETEQRLGRERARRGYAVHLEIDEFRADQAKENVRTDAEEDRDERPRRGA